MKRYIILCLLMIVSIGIFANYESNGGSFLLNTYIIGQFESVNRQDIEKDEFETFYRIKANEEPVDVPLKSDEYVLILLGVAMGTGRLFWVIKSNKT